MIRFVFTFLVLVVPLFSAPEYPNRGPDIFDPKEEGERIVEQAVALASKQNKRVVLFLGANWCPWCRRLHQAFTTHPVLIERLRSDFVLAYVDVNFKGKNKRNSNLNTKYGNPLRFGLPALVVLDTNGALLVTKETQSFSDPSDQVVAERVEAFLAQWAR